MYTVRSIPKIEIEPNEPNECEQLEWIYCSHCNAPILAAETYIKVGNKIICLHCHNKMDTTEFVKSIGGEVLIRDY